MRTLAAFVACLLLSAAALAQTYQAACDIANFAPSSDGNFIWYTCAAPNPAPQSGIAGGTPKDWGRTLTSTLVLDIRTDQSREVMQSQGPIEISPAPVGSGLLIHEAESRWLWYVRGPGADPVQLPSGFGIWNGDGTTVYFGSYHSPAAELYDEISRYDLISGRLVRKRLRHHASFVEFCGDEVFISSFVRFDQKGQTAKWSSDRYSSDLKFIGTDPEVPAGNFSATCRYVASTPSFHGPLPWQILDRTTNLTIGSFHYSGENKQDEFAPIAWNPVRDELLLAIYEPASASRSADIFRVYNVVTKQWSGNWTDNVRWAADGDHVIVAHGKTFTIEPLPQ